jgi:hypothetical protein
LNRNSHRNFRTKLERILGEQVRTAGTASGSKINPHRIAVVENQLIPVSQQRNTGRHIPAHDANRAGPKEV